MSHIVRANSAPNESFCKLRSTCGLNNELDIHGFTWNERLVLEVTAFDRTRGLISLRNNNGLTWISDLKRYEFCTAEGGKIYNQ